MTVPEGSSPPISDIVQRQVSTTANRLYATRMKGSTAASFARLRANVGRAPGTDPAIWSLTIEGLPGALDRDAPTAAEYAVHGALTLFAHHQRAVVAPMHRSDTGLGKAIRQLETKRGHVGQDGGVSPVRRRFDAAVVSPDVRTLLLRLKPLINQLRGDAIALDYGQLASDIYRWHFADGADQTRRRWARQYYHYVSPTDNPATDEVRASTPEETS